MKKIFCLAIVCTIAICGFSQTDTMMNKGMMDSSNHKMMGKMKDCIMMKGGTPMLMKGGQTMAMDQQMTLSNGTMVMTDGTVKMKDGQTKMMKEGDCIYMDGTMGKMGMHDKMKMKKMKSDSTMKR